MNIGMVIIEWGTITEPGLNKVRLVGIVRQSSNNEFSYKGMIAESMQIIKIAEKHEGVLLPISDQNNLFKKQEYVSFDVIFNNRANYESFIQTMKNRYS